MVIHHRGNAVHSHRRIAAASLLVVLISSPRLAAAPPSSLPLPSQQQLAWQRGELTMFLHFGVNTFTDREWGDGREDEKLFNPTDLDARQWTRVAKDAGFKLLILTAKHHDGFCLWPTRQTEHCVRNSPWKAGQGDVVREFVNACRAEGLKVGLYLSPWDRNHPDYGSDAYNDHFVRQLTELLTGYGPIDELWFDGACGEGPNGKKQVYAWPRYYATIRKLAPDALIAICGPDIRWVGNESGVAKVGESSVRPADKDVDGQPTFKWYPAECDVSIRPGWFYHASEDTKVKSLAKLMEIYFASVGRNSVLLLNVPPDRRGLLADADVQRLKEFGQAVRDLHESKLQPHAVTASESSGGHPAALAVDNDLDTFWSPAEGTRQGWLQLEFDAPREINVLNVQEAIALGERVSRYRIDAEQNGQWQTLARGTVIGQRNLHPLAKITAARLRLVIEEAKAEPCIALFSAHLAPVIPPPPTLSLTTNRPARASNVHGNSTSFGADKAVDGDENTRWATDDPTRECWLEVDLEQPQVIGRVSIHEFAPRITRFTVEFKLEPDAPWQIAYRGTEAGKQFRATFPPVTARWVRLHILEASFAPTIWEFAAWAP